MSRFIHHVFVCTNRRPDDNPKGSCAQKGSEGVLDLFKAGLAKRGLKGKIRANSSGCLDACATGVTVLVYPDDIWYGHVTAEDVEEIIEEHLVNGRPVARLRLPESNFRKPIW